MGTGTLAETARGPLVGATGSGEGGVVVGVVGAELCADVVEVEWPPEAEFG
jgi:hypothetical protein